MARRRAFFVFAGNAASAAFTILSTMLRRAAARKLAWSSIAKGYPLVVSHGALGLR
jgi:hypothetical protein